MKNIAIFASGTGSNAVRLHQYFAEKDSEINVALLVCNKAGAAVVQKMEDFNIPVFILSNKEIESGNSLLQKLEEDQINWIVLAGFLRKIPDLVIKRYTNKIINIHPSLLPKYGGKGMYGMNVHKAVVDNKEIKSGISIHLVNQDYDDGKILFQKSCALSPYDLPEDVAKKIQQLEHEYFPKVVEETINQSVNEN